MSLVTEQLRRLAYRAQFYLDVPSLVQLLKFRQMRQRYYQELWRQAAPNIGAEYQDWKFGLGRISRSGLTTIVKQSSVMLDDHLTLELMGNKALVYKLMSELGYAVPKHLCFTMASRADCGAFFSAQDRPVVVKPTSGTGGGRGVTTGITSLRALRKAARLAASFDDHLLVEEQIEGGSYRLLYLDGEFIDAVRRDPPVVAGDGRRTIRQLVKDENTRRLRGDPVTALSPLKIDRDCQNKLRATGLTPGSRPGVGEVIEIKRAVNENDREKNHNVRRDVHRETIAAGARLVRALGVTFAGLDVICKDISIPLGASNGLISEINTTPGIHHHYLISEARDRVPVADIVLEYMFESMQGVMKLDENVRVLRATDGPDHRTDAAVAQGVA